MNTVFVVVTQSDGALVRILDNEEAANKVRDLWNSKSHLGGAVVEQWHVWSECIESK